MQVSSINLLAVGLSLLCFVSPLHSDLQRSYWANYELYNPVIAVSQPNQRILQFPERYSPSTIQRPLSHVTLYESGPRSVYETNHFQRPSVSLGYPERTPETRYPQTEGYRSQHDFVPSTREDKSKEDGAYFKEEDAESGSNEEEIMEKMRILDRVLSEDTNKEDLDVNGIEDKIIPEESKRVVRAVRKQKPGFFWTLARITFETINDTRSAIKQISDIINNNIAPDSATENTVMSGSLTAASSPSPERNMTAVSATETMETTTSSPSTTTRAPIVLTRARLQSIIRRNVLGLVRLFNIEWKDALNQSEITVKEFQKDLGNQVGIYLRDNPNAY